MYLVNLISIYYFQHIFASINKPNTCSKVTSTLCVIDFKEERQLTDIHLEEVGERANKPSNVDYHVVI